MANETPLPLVGMKDGDGGAKTSFDFAHFWHSRSLEQSDIGAISDKTRVLVSVLFSTSIHHCPDRLRNICGNVTP